MAHDIIVRERKTSNGGWKRLVIGFKGKDQSPLFMIFKEYRRYRRAEVEWADCLFSTGNFYYIKFYLWDKPMSIWKGRIKMRPRWRRESKLSWSWQGSRWTLDIDFFSFALGVGIEVSNGSCFLALPFFLVTREAR